MGKRAAVFGSRTVVVVVTLFLTMAPVPPRAGASIIFSNLPANGFSGLIASSADSAPSSFHDFDLALPFSVPSTQRWSGALLPLVNLRGSGAVAVMLMSNLAGLPGAVIESRPLTVSATSGFPLQTITSVQQPVLTVGLTYWIAISTDVGSDVAWGNHPTARGYGYRRDSGAWQFDALNLGLAMEVDGAPLPEPAAAVSVTLMLASLTSIAGRRHRSACAQQFRHGTPRFPPPNQRTR